MRGFRTDCADFTDLMNETEEAGMKGKKAPPRTPIRLPRPHRSGIFLLCACVPP